MGRVGRGAAESPCVAGGGEGVAGVLRLRLAAGGLGSLLGAFASAA